MTRRSTSKRPKTVPRRIQEGLESLHILSLFLCRFWFILSSILGFSGGPFGPPNRSKIDPKIYQKSPYANMLPRDHSKRHQDRPQRPPDPPKRLQDRPKRPQDRRKMRQDRPKMPPERSKSGQEGSWNDFGVIMRDLGAILGSKMCVFP